MSLKENSRRPVSPVNLRNFKKKEKENNSVKISGIIAH